MAEELHVPPARFRLVMADTQLTPFDMGTFGSRTTPDMSRRLRRAAAAAREALIDVAAEIWKTDRSLLSAANGAITNSRTKESLELRQARPRGASSPRSSPTMRRPARRKTGRSPAIRRRKSMAVRSSPGKHQYASDIRLPGMWFGKVLRPPTIGATLTSIDTDAGHGHAGCGRGSRRRLRRCRRADRTAGRACAGGDQGGVETRSQDLRQDLFDDLKSQRGQNAGQGGGEARASPPVRCKAGLAAADVRLEQTYTIAYIAHAPLEPRAAVAQWDEGKLTVWTGTQRPFGVRGELAGGVSASPTTPCA